MIPTYEKKNSDGNSITCGSDLNPKIRFSFLGIRLLSQISEGIHRIELGFEMMLNDPYQSEKIT
jgi:hypothetical protein